MSSQDSKENAREDDSTGADEITGPLDAEALTKLIQSHVLEEWEKLDSPRNPDDLIKLGIDEELVRAAALMNRVFPLPGVKESEKILEAPAAIGRFEIRELLGFGTFGVVWRAYDPWVSREVALKVIQQGQLHDQKHRQRFLRECMLGGKLNHPGICPVFEVGSFEGTPYLVMPVCSGVTLDKWLTARKKPIEIAEAVSIAHQLAIAVSHGHQSGVLHRDLKPSNIMVEEVSEPNSRLIVRVLDFGLAISLDDSLRETRSSLIAGTPNYMAPEQILCRPEQIGRPCDIYSIGAILYEVLCGRTPYNAPNLPTLIEKVMGDPIPLLSKIRQDVPKSLEAICHKCLVLNPSARYQSLDELAEDLHCFSVGGLVRARRSSRLQRFLEWCETHRGRQQLTATAIVINVIVMTWSILSLPSALQQIPADKMSWAEIFPIVAPLFGGIIPLHWSLIWLAAKIRRNASGHWASLVGTALSALVLIFAILVLLDRAPATPSPAYATNSFARQLAFTLVSLSFTSLTAIFGLLSWSGRNRRLPVRAET